jgi:hypothetical protein
MSIKGFDMTASIIIIIINKIISLFKSLLVNVS